MFNRQDFKVNQKVYFGRPQGEHTLGQIERLNPVKAAIKILEVRGTGRGGELGAIWKVPYSMMWPADTNAKPGVPAVPPPAPVRSPMAYIPFAYVDNLLLEALSVVYCHLSPENLTCDGELPRAQVVRRSNELQRQVRGICLALGREVSGLDVHEWEMSKKAYEDKHGVRKPAVLSPLVSIPPLPPL
jgi:hypothetical protein